jgi:hypothetical protein
MTAGLIFLNFFQKNTEKNIKKLPKEYINYEA